MENLSQYFQSKGLTLPAFGTAERATLAKNAGISNYTGSAEQNATMLNYLKSTDKPSGQTSPTINLTPPATANVNANNLGTPIVNLPTATPASIPTPPNVAEQILNAMKVEETDAQKQASNISKNILSIIPNLQGQAQSLADEEKKAGVSDLKTKLNDVNTMILTKTAELNQDDVNLVRSLTNLEKQNIPIEFITGQQQSVEREAKIARALKASEIGILNATSLALQGSLTQALDTAKQAVELKFAPFREAISLYKDQLTALEPILSKDEKKQATAQNLKMQLALKELDRKQDVEDANTKLIVNATGQNAPASVLSKAKSIANNGGSTADVASALGIYSGDYLETRIKQMQLEKLGVDLKKARIEMSQLTNPTGLSSLSYEENAKFNATPEVKNINTTMAYQRALADYKDAINKYGTGEIFGTGAGVLGSTYSALVGATKDYYTLGTYDNGVQKLIGLGIPEPSIYGLKANRIGALDSAMKTANAKMKSDVSQLSNTRYAGTQEFASLLNRVSESGLNSMDNSSFLNLLPSTGTSGATGGNASFFNTLLNQTTTKATAF